MSLTGTSIITEALEELAAITPGDALTTIESTKGLAVLNRLILSTNIAKGNIFTQRIDTWSTVIGQQTYTIGVDPAGILTPNLAAARPIKLTRANLLLTSGGTTVRRKIDLLDKEQWQAKKVQAGAGMPIELYNDGANPLSKYWIYQIPDQVYQFETYSWQQFAALSAVSDVLQIPAGYYEYWLYALAIRLAAPFGRTPTAATIELFRQAREDVQTRNAETPRISGDGDLPGGSGGMYNWLSGTLDGDDD